MKKIAALRLPMVLVLLLSCAGTDSARKDSAPLADAQIQSRIGSFLQDWLSMVRDGKYDNFERVMGSGLQMTLIRGDGAKTVTREAARILGFHEEFFGALEADELPSAESARYYLKTESGKPQAQLDFRGAYLTAFFEFGSAGKKLQPEKMFLLEKYEKDLQADLFQQWADVNHNGVLEPEEQRILYETVRDFPRRTRQVRNDLDAYFDRNEDGWIDEIELEYARDILWRDIPHRIHKYQPEFYRSYLDPAQEGLLMSIHILNGLYYFFYDFPDFMNPRSKREDPLDQLADFNRDGYLNIVELEHYRDMVGRKISQLPPPPVDIKKPAILHKDLQLWADVDTNDEYDDLELSDFSWMVYELILEFHDLAVTPIDFYFNLNHNYFLEAHEKRYAFTYLLSKYLPLFVEENPDFFARHLDLNENGAIDREEIDEIGNWLTTTINVRRSIKSELDKKIDDDDNGWIDQYEFDFFRESLLPRLCAYWLLDDHASADRWQVLTDLDRLTDLNANGFINAEEREQAGLGLKSVHEVATDFDRRIDTNADDFIDEYEIQEAWMLGTRQSEDIRLTGAARGTGTKLAVVGAVAEGSDITEAVSGIVLVYIENAFVDTELYQVLERRNLDAILEEQEFMLSDLADEENIIEIGNLAGAEMVGIAELSQVDGVYYINIRLVETETGKIKASSMAESDDFRRLFGMCSQAVEQLH